MAENDKVLNTVATEPETPASLQESVAEEVKPLSDGVAAEKPSKLNAFGAALKEWGRKKIVGLKRKPQSITLVALFITTALYLIWLFTFSRTIYENTSVKWCGLVVFINTLVSILIIALYGSAFPKRSKPNVVFVVLLFVFMAIIIFCDVMYYVEMNTYLHTSIEQGGAGYGPEQFANKPYMEQSLSLAIAHIVLVAICALLLATMPVYSKLINMINTKKDVESTQMKEAIDVSEEG